MQYFYDKVVIAIEFINKKIIYQQCKVKNLQQIQMIELFIIVFIYISATVLEIFINNKFNYLLQKFQIQDIINNQQKDQFMNITKEPEQNKSSSCPLSIRETYDRGLYQILSINKTLNKNILSMAYTPGVGAVCKEIEKKPELVNELTLRGRSVAIITQGKCFPNEKVEPGQMTIVVDWCIAQIKFYAGVDSFPFIIRQGANITNVIKDLANTYAAILILDAGLQFNEKQIPNDVAIVRQETIAQIHGREITDCEDTAFVLGHVLKNKIRGIVSKDVIVQGSKFVPGVFKKQSSYFILYRDGRTTGQKSIDFHREFQGKIHIELNFSNIAQLKKCFTSKGLLQFIKSHQRRSGYQHVSAIVTDATAILGFGDIGPKAGLPVMEGKSLLFKILGGVNVVPVCINKRKTYEQTVEAILDIASYFKAINLQDIKAPECFFIERTLKQKKILPVFHDDQHGTAIVTVAALINALKLVNKKMEDLKILITGVGAAGITICKLLIKSGVKNIIMADTKGAIYEGRDNLNSEKQALAKITNPQKIKGSVGQIVKGTDVFIGVSGPGTLKKQNVKAMAEKPIIFALANPDPEITLDDALQGGAFIYGSGRSDFKNQINNSIVFPGIFRGIHQHDLPQITDEMKLFIAHLIADNIDRGPTPRHIIVDSLDLDMPVLISNGLKKFKSVKKPEQNSKL